MTQFFASFAILLAELRLAWRAHDFWERFAWNSIRQRYQRSLLGPLWLWLHTALLIVILGPLYSQIFNVPLRDYFLYVAVGIIVWQFISQLITDMSNIYVHNAHFILDTLLPLGSYHCMTFLRHAIVFLHGFVIIALLSFFFSPVTWPAYVISFAGFVMLLIVLLPWSFIIAALGVRYRDIAHIIQSLLQIAFYATPLLWKPEMLKDYAFVAYFNPFYHMVQLIRAPLLGQEVLPATYLYLAVVFGLGILLAAPIHSYAKRRLVYWL